MLSSEQKKLGYQAVKTCIHPTKLILDKPLSRFQNRPVWLKPEQLQPGGSYKIRTAAMSLALLPDKKRGVVAASGGNFAISLALAAKQQNIPVTLVLPAASLEEKRTFLQKLGAKILVGDQPGYDAAEEKARRLAKEDNKPFLSPTEGEIVYAANRSIAKEIFQENPDVELLCAAVGGGGLVIGLALEAKEHGAQVLGASPEGACAMARSLEENRPFLSDLGGETWAEPLLGGVPLQNFTCARQLLSNIVVLPEKTLLPAMRSLYERHGFLVEAAGAVPYALVSTQKLPGNTPLVIILSGGNLSPDRVGFVVQKAER